MNGPDFRIVRKNGAAQWKSKMVDGDWRSVYPQGALSINGFTYRLLSEDVMDLYVVSANGKEIRILAMPDWGSYRFFCHNNGRAVMAEGPGGEYIGTTFGVIYLDMKVIHRFFFMADGNLKFSAEGFDIAQPIL